MRGDGCCDTCCRCGGGLEAYILTATLSWLYLHVSNQFYAKQIFQPPAGCAGGGGLRLLFLLAFLSVTSLLELQGQTLIPCQAIADCDMLEVVLIKQTESVLAGPDCPAAVGCADPFRQTAYKVYLRYKVPEPATGPMNFLLDYSRLNVRVQLTGSSAQRSHIAKTKTLSCFENSHRSTWVAPPPNAPMGGNYAILDVKDPQTVAFDLNNTEQGSVACGQASINQIQFTAPSLLSTLPCPSGFDCSYVELFEVVINVYPGEQAFLGCQVSGSEYAAFDQTNGVKCSPLDCVNQTVPPIAPSTVATYVGTSNSSFLVSLTGTGIDPATKNCSTNVELSAGGPTLPVSVSYLEFLVEVSSMNKVTVEGLPGTVSAAYISNDGTKQYIHFVLEFDPAVSSFPLSLGKIIVERPLAQNVAWSSTLKLINEEQSRIKTDAACTRVDLSATEAVCSDTGDPQCQPGIATLSVKALNSSNCAQTQVQIGISSTALNLTGMDLEMTFALTGGMTLSAFNFGDFAGSLQDPCPTNSTGCTNGTANCYAISGNTLKVCFNTSPGMAFSGTKNMNVFFVGAGCIQGVTVTKANIFASVSVGCVPEISLSNSGFPKCPASIGGRLATEEGKGLEEATVTLGPSTCSSCSGTCPASVLSLGGKDPAAGKYAFCPSCVCDKYLVTPSHDKNPLNGVSTYDLVLISKHILGLEPLTSPYKMIAADANKSGSITTFDIVEFRKLILGIYPIKLPSNTSWRFVDKGFVFPFPDNPFKTIFPEVIDYCTAIPSDPQNLDFVAIKVGDLNANAIAHARPAKRPEVGLAWIASNAQAGTTLTVPVTYTGDRPAEAIQLGLRFDPARLRLIGPSKGSLPGFSAGNFNLNDAAKGEIRTLWIPDYTEPDRHIQPGDVLFYLTFKVLTQTASAEPLLQLDNALLENLAWTAEGTECEVKGTAVQQRDDPAEALPGVSAAGWLKASCSPNPTSGAASLRAESAKAGKARFWLLDASGRRLLLRDIVLDADTPQELALPELVQMPAGIYLWKLSMSGERVEGRLVKE